MLFSLKIALFLLENSIAMQIFITNSLICEAHWRVIIQSFSFQILSSMSSWVFSSSRCLCVCGPWVPGSTSNRLSIALTASSSRDPCLRWSGRISSQRQDHSVCQFSELSGYSEYSKSRSKYGFSKPTFFSHPLPFFYKMCTLLTHHLTFSGIF